MNLSPNQWADLIKMGMMGTMLLVALWLVLTNNYNTTDWVKDPRAMLLMAIAFLATGGAVFAAGGWIKAVAKAIAKDEPKDEEKP